MLHGYDSGETPREDGHLEQPEEAYDYAQAEETRHYEQGEEAYDYEQAEEADHYEQAEEDDHHEQTEEAYHYEQAEEADHHGVHNILLVHRDSQTFWSNLERKNISDPPKMDCFTTEINVCEFAKFMNPDHEEDDYGYGSLQDDEEVWESDGEGQDPQTRAPPTPPPPPPPLPPPQPRQRPWSVPKSLPTKASGSSEIGGQVDSDSDTEASNGPSSLSRKIQNDLRYCDMS